MPKFSDFLGTVRSLLQIGIGGSGVRTLRFRNGFQGDLTWNPTANRAIAMPDKDGIVAVTQDFLNNISIQGYRPIVSVTATKTFSLTDAGTYNYCTNAAAATMTVPLNSAVAFPIGSEIEIKKGGAGALSIAATAGVTINRDGGTAATLPLALTKGCTLKKVATDIWILEGS